MMFNQIWHGLLPYIFIFYLLIYLFIYLVIFYLSIHLYLLTYLLTYLPTYLHIIYLPIQPLIYLILTITCNH
jgi:hypothetical protein